MAPPPIAYTGSPESRTSYKQTDEAELGRKSYSCLTGINRLFVIEADEAGEEVPLEGEGEDEGAEEEEAREQPDCR